MKLSLLLGSCIAFILQSHVNAFDLEILESGNGKIGISGGKSPWTSKNSFTMSKNAKKKIQRVNPSDIRNISRGVQKTWEPDVFTDFADVPKGKKIGKFRFLVHGLELKAFVEGLNQGSFDDFVKAKLWSDCPLGEDFIPYYPYSLFRKSVISASVVTQNVTATFGEFGFILSVPSSHYLFGDIKDIHTPTDIQFYGTNYVGDARSLGEYELKNRACQHPLASLEALIPSNPQERVPSHVTTTTYPNRASYNQSEEDNISNQEIINMARRMTGRDPSPQQIRQMKTIAAAQFASFQPMFEAMGIDSVAQSRNGRIERTEKRSSYNEVGLVPFDPSEETYVKISGIFLRCGKSERVDFLNKSHIQKMLQMAADFNLPVVMIHDGTKYETNL